MCPGLGAMVGTQGGGMGAQRQGMEGSEVSWSEGHMPRNGIWGTWRVTRVRDGCPELRTGVPGCHQGKGWVPMDRGTRDVPG